jgi:hypothetical protein
VLESTYAAVHGSTIAEPATFKHKRWWRPSPSGHPTPARKRADPPLAGEGEDHGETQRDKEQLEGEQHEH